MFSELSFAFKDKPKHNSTTNTKPYSNIPWKESGIPCQLCDSPGAALGLQRSQERRCHKPLELATRSGGRSLPHALPLLRVSGSCTLFRTAAGLASQPLLPPWWITPSPLLRARCLYILKSTSVSQLVCSSCGKAAFIYTGSLSTALPTSHPSLNSTAGDYLNLVSFQPTYTLLSYLDICAAFNHNSHRSPDKIKLKETRHSCDTHKKPPNCYLTWFRISVCVAAALLADDALSIAGFCLSPHVKKWHLKEKRYLHVGGGEKKKNLNSQVKYRRDFKSGCLVMMVLSLFCQ